MSFHRKSVLILVGSGIIGGWWLWRHASKKQRTVVTNQMNHTDKKGVFPEWLSEEPAMTPCEGISTPQAVPCVLSHSYVSIDARTTCTPGHWHATYWLRFIARIEQEPRRAIVQHTDTKRYHLMMQLPAKQSLSCEDCFPSQEVFRFPVQDHYASFVFIPQQDLDGFTLLPQAQEAAQTRSISPDFHSQLLLGEQTESMRGEMHETFREIKRKRASMQRRKQ